MVHGAGFPHHALAQQGLNNLWTCGYNGFIVEEPYGSFDLNFTSTDVLITTEDWWMDYGRTVANISDEDGNLLFSTNGVYVADANGNLMQNGGGLNPSSYTSQHSSPPSGLHISQGCLILPKPDTPGIYYLVHSTIDILPYARATALYLTTVDMALANGLGGVVSKNQILVADTLNGGKVTAVRHANGRDWWVFCHKAYTNAFYRLLVSPSGVSVDGVQNIGSVRAPDHGQVCFSPDGTKFAYYGDLQSGDMDIYDFDRCTGLFSNTVQVPIPDANNMAGVAFSPNSRYVYVTSVLDVNQFDTEASDIAASMVHIAHWDSTYSPSPPFATLFDIAQLAPDGKIYIGTGNSGLRLHVINNPDEPGLACNMVQHGVVLPRLNINSLPNHPNYFLGPLAGSPCDTLALGVAPLSLGEGPGVRAYPDPSPGTFTLSYPAQPTVGEMEVRDMAGRVVLRERLPQWSTVHQVELAGQAAGMYQCKLTWPKGSVATHVILER